MKLKFQRNLTKPELIRNCFFCRLSQLLEVLQEVVVVNSNQEMWT